jgi:hypothetical protein
MKNISSYIFLLLLIVSAGCKKDFLQDGSTTEGPITEAQIWANDVYARGVLNNAYTHLPDEYDMDGNGAMLASGSDEAVNSNLNSSVNILNNGTWGPVRTFDNVYTNMYQGLRKVNLFLDNVATAAILPAAELANGTTADTSLQAQVIRLRGQALFLRAQFHFELVKRYGAVTLATKVFSREEELNLPRNTYQECVDQIVRDCDSAAAMLPEWTETWSTSNRGRATKTAALAVKARTLLYAASPLNNPGGDVAKWQAAADAAKAIITINKHVLVSPYNNVFLFGTAPYNKEVIFATKANNRNDIESYNAPISYTGALGRTNPTQEMIDAFEMTNGRPITAAGSTYNPDSPYARRDPRMALVINYNTRKFKTDTVRTYIGGKDGLNLSLNATKTGYYMRKFMNENVSWNVQTVTNSRRPWVMYRLAETYLNYAEALNEAQGPVADVYNYMKLVRVRAGFNATAATLPAGISKDSMRIRIQNERRVELCFEGHRFYDIRRWKQGDIYLNKPVMGMRIRLLAPGVYSYERFLVENRVFTDKNYLFPFSQSDINRQPALVQNPGY